MNRKWALAAIGAIIGAMLVIGGWTWLSTRQDLRVPIHLGKTGSGYFYLDQLEVLLAMPAIAAGLTALLFLPMTRGPSLFSMALTCSGCGSPQPSDR